MTDRAGRDSRCCNPHAAPYQWLVAYDVENPAYRELEEWLSGLSPFAEQVERGEIDDLFEAASEGKLWDSGDAKTPIKPINRDPEIFELRRTALAKLLRFYHAEPERYPEFLVALHQHIKVDAQDQSTQIEFAVSRYKRS